ncbi:rho GTPase-activating protein 7 isoform X4 [Peromyscus californicus insignis]|uniref:rho GTPase-activating protein 7 isoform X4 n=1 Tax=Peromyscus californicus insignis TaxID=564181 RepID=UPI0022A6820C|nr:rho GTPase-activating protein 7 isoform X4 [Peromyscus californicus insignis]
MGDPEDHVMARPLRAPLRRSFSDHIRDSTARALDAIWKNTRERRLAGKSVKLEVAEDKRTKESIFTPSEVAIGLSPYTFPQEKYFHVPEEKHFALTRVLAGRTTAAGSPHGPAERRALQQHLTMSQFHQR